MECGEQCVVICGDQQMQLLCADNLATPVQVCFLHTLCRNLSFLFDQEQLPGSMLHMEQALVLSSLMM